MKFYLNHLSRPTETVDVYRFIVDNVVKQTPQPVSDLSSTLTSSLLSMSINDRVDCKSTLSSASSTLSYGKMPVSALQEYLQKRGEPIPGWLKEIKFSLIQFHIQSTPNRMAGHRSRSLLNVAI